MSTRREFLVSSARVSIGGLAALALYGCEEKKISQRNKLIEQLQYSAKDLVDYRIGNGYVYDVEVDGKPVHVNLSHSYFTTRGNLLKYTIEKTDVRVYKHGKVKVWCNGTLVKDPNVVSIAQELTDKVLEAVIKENERIKKATLEQTRKDLDQFSI